MSLSSILTRIRDFIFIVILALFVVATIAVFCAEVGARGWSVSAIVLLLELIGTYFVILGGLIGYEFSYKIVRSRGMSMLPNIPPFGLHLIHPIYPDTPLSVGDVVSFLGYATLCDDCNQFYYQPIQHRIIKIRKVIINDLEMREITTKGDNNTHEDQPVLESLLLHRLKCQIIPYWLGWACYSIRRAWNGRWNIPKRPHTLIVRVGGFVKCRVCHSEKARVQPWYRSAWRLRTVLGYDDVVK